jgi:PIN domain nuclease of toxin-antitoxin system
MPAERLLLDTHALLWWQAGSDRLSRRAATAIEGVDQLWISAISLWEIATLVRLGRIALDRPQRRWVADLLAGSVECLDGDPADRIIYATAQEHRMALVTKDRRLSDHAASQGFPVVW